MSDAQPLGDLLERIGRSRKEARREPEDRAEEGDASKIRSCLLVGHDEGGI